MHRTEPPDTWPLHAIAARKRYSAALRRAQADAFLQEAEEIEAAIARRDARRAAAREQTPS